MVADRHWTEEYARLTNRILGIALPTEYRSGSDKLHSVYPPESEWFAKALDALLAVEHEYVERLLQEIKNQSIPGAFAEFGVYQGAWINRLHDMTERTGLSDRQIWGFDSFAGLSRPDPSVDGPFWKEGMYAVSRSQVEVNVAATQRPRIHLVEGFFSESLKGAAAARLGEVAFARIDCDIYEPALDCLWYLGPRLVNGSVLVFDDWAHHQELGETRAFFEWVPSVPHFRFEFLFLGPWDHCYMRVWHK